MDKDKLFDIIESELNHYCRFICDRWNMCIEYDIVESEACEICQVKNFVETLKREILVDKL
jgi:hypothetical protein